MKESLLELFQQNPQMAIAISLLISILIAVIGLLPSFFITAANILFFGFWQGTLLSFLGEALGAVVAFLLYRKGFKKAITQQLVKFPKAQQLVLAKGKQAFLLVVSLRLLPFVPSGIVTFGAAVGTMTAFQFLIASSVGKAPALLIEAYSVHQVTRFQWQGKLILAVAAISLLIYALRHFKRNGKTR